MDYYPRARRCVVLHYANVRKHFEITPQDVRDEVLNLERKREAGTLDDRQEMLRLEIENQCGAPIRVVAKQAYAQWEAAAAAVKSWMGTPPVKCDLCPAAIDDKFYDARVPGDGRWGCLCPKCFRDFGCSVGTGRGQEYTRVNDRFVKTAG